MWRYKMQKNSRTRNWKEVASGFSDKSLALAILFVLFAMLVSPSFKTKPFDRVIEDFIGVDIPNIEDPVILQPVLARPDVIITFDDELIGEDDEDIPTVDTIPKTVLEPEAAYIDPSLLSNIKHRHYEDEPVATYRVAPPYPKFYRDAGIEGTVILDVEILTDGTVGKVELVQSVFPGKDGLDELSIAAAKQWIFQPAKTNNQPVKIWVTYPFNFKLE
jgi:TonB family protein